MCIPCGYAFSLVPKSSAKVNVKYQYHIFQNMVIAGALVFHKHILFLMENCLITFLCYQNKTFPNIRKM